MQVAHTHSKKVEEAQGRSPLVVGQWEHVDLSKQDGQQNWMGDVGWPDNTFFLFRGDKEYWYFNIWIELA